MSGAGGRSGNESATAAIGWVVDVQVDFMEPHGRLYVRDPSDPDDPGAASMLPTLERAVAWMERRCAVMVYTGDWHALDDREIDEERPDPARNTFPPHCLGRSSDADERAGAEIVASLRPEDPLVLTHDATAGDARAVARRAVAEGRPVVVRKNEFSVFEGNKAAADFIRSLGEALGRPLEFVVAGVAREVCVAQAVEGLQDRGYPVVAVQDATWGLGLEPEEETLARWARRGRVARSAELDGVVSGRR